MDSSNSVPNMEAQKAYKKYVSLMERSVHFWSEARGESRKITAARLKCVPHSDVAESLALTIWERMRSEQFRLVVEMDRILTQHDEIRVAELRETLGQILEAVDVDVKELRAIHSTPIEALTLLLNHIIKIYNRRDVDSDASSDSFVPVSTRIDQMVAKAKELGLGNIEVPKNIYVSDRAKLAMVEKQMIGRMKLKSLKVGVKIHDVRNNVKFKVDGVKKRDEARKRMKKVVAIKEKLKQAQCTKGSISKLCIAYKASDRSLLNSSSSFVKSEENQTIRTESSYHSLSSSVPPDGSIENVMITMTNNEKSEKQVYDGLASIDTSGWVISPMHNYYFGCSPPVIPTTSVTHEVYPKPVDDSKMTYALKNICSDVNIMYSGSSEEDKEMNWEFPGKNCSKSQCSLARSRLKETASVVEFNQRRQDQISTASSESVERLNEFLQEETMNCEESQGDASTIFAWTEPEKSQSFCLNSTENVEIEVTTDGSVLQASSEAAGDGCDLERTKEESNIYIQDEELPEVLPPAPFSMTNLTGDDSNCSSPSETLVGVQTNNELFCADSVETTKFRIYEGERTSGQLSGKGDLESINTISGTQETTDVDSQGDPHSSSYNEDFSQPEQAATTSESLEILPAESNLPRKDPDELNPSRVPEEQQNLTFHNITLTSIRPMPKSKNEKIMPAQKYAKPSSPASVSANQTLTRSIIDELTSEIAKRNTKADEGSVQQDVAAGSDNSDVIGEQGSPSSKENPTSADDIGHDSHGLVGGQNEVDITVGINKQDSFTDDLQNIDLGKSSEAPETSTQKVVQPQAKIAQQTEPDTPLEVSYGQITDAGSCPILDQFSSAHDVSSPSLQYLKQRPRRLKSRVGTVNANFLGKDPISPNCSRVIGSDSTHSQYELIPDLTPSEANTLNREEPPKKEGKRNDMVTLALLALALGLGTLGYMTSAGTGNIFSEIMGPAGGKALNIIDKAFQVLKALNNRH